MISWDLNAPLNASIPSPHNAVHFAVTKTPSISCIIQLRYVRSQLTSALYETRRFPVERISTHARGEFPGPAKASWPVCFSLGDGLAWFTWTNQTREMPEPGTWRSWQSADPGQPCKFAMEVPVYKNQECQERSRMRAARVQQWSDRNASKWIARQATGGNRWQPPKVETELIFMLLCELSGYSVVFRNSECGDSQLSHDSGHSLVGSVPRDGGTQPDLESDQITI